MVIDDLTEEEGEAFAERYAPIITGRKAFISLQTDAEVRYGALRRGWCTARMLRLDTKIHQAEVVHSGPELVLVYAQLRADCEAAGHALDWDAHLHRADSCPGMRGPEHSRSPSRVAEAGRCEGSGPGRRTR